MRNVIMRQISDQEFEKIVLESISYSEICRKINLRIQGSNFYTIKNRIKRQNISTDHFNRSHGSISKNTIPLEEILIQNSNYGSNQLKKRLIKKELLKNECYSCGLKAVWNGESIVLQLDHINGNHKDNRLENLRILCPNCHSQTKTHSGKRLKRTYYCTSCNKEYAGYGRTCVSCKKKTASLSVRENIINWPDIEIVKIKVWEKTLSECAKEIGCSLTAIKKFCFRNNIDMPPQGYWQRRKSGYSHEQSLVSQKKIRKPMKILSNESIKQIKLMREKGVSCREIAKTFQTHHTTISRIVRNKSYTHVGVP